MPLSGSGLKISFLGKISTLKIMDIIDGESVACQYSVSLNAVSQDGLVEAVPSSSHPSNYLASVRLVSGPEQLGLGTGMTELIMNMTLIGFSIMALISISPSS